MPGCNERCSCNIQAGPGVEVIGSGTVSNPFIISSGVTLAESLVVNDTESLNLTLTGSGNSQDPFILRGEATLKLTTLSDVRDPEGGPAVGEGPVWVGVGADGHWEFKLPVPVPAGSVNVSYGIAGAGSVSDPLHVSTLSAGANGALSGLEVYVDTDGNLRAVPPQATSVDWSVILNKPSTFPPAAHTQAGTTILTTGAFANAQLFLNSHETRITANTADVTALEAKTGSGQVYDSARVQGHKIFSGNTTPSGPVAGDLWFRKKT